jgi:hypothetical protein
MPRGALDTTTLYKFGFTFGNILFGNYYLLGIRIVVTVGIFPFPGLFMKQPRICLSKGSQVEGDVFRIYEHR